ncbi:MAG: hypothetical protein JWR09_3586 [Mucilaginibacter sp.]|nr:hypothetical protein [Mucilaginibacter sp.]
MNKTIVVFEHQKLTIDEQIFHTHQFEALVRFNETHGGKYFKPGFRNITFNSYVGVIQIGNVIIEILPKADNLGDEQAFNKWQNAFLFMLKTANNIKLNYTEKAAQQVRQRPLMDLYIYHFLQLTESLLNGGLAKRYRRESGNLKVLKGKLLLNKQISQNNIHKERFFTEHIIYDRNTLLNQLLKKTLDFILKNSVNNELVNISRKLILHFEGIDLRPLLPVDLKQRVYDRKTVHYQEAVDLAQLILQQNSPIMSFGRQSVLAVLFDMNRLFESFIFKILKAQEGNFLEFKLKVIKQPKVLFWRDKHIKADIILEFDQDIEGFIQQKKVIIDTKWKQMKGIDPADEDLKQMFTYNFQFGSMHSILLYPYMNTIGSGKQSYKSSYYFKEFDHSCEISFANLFNSEGIYDRKWAPNFLDQIVQNI